MPSIAERVQTEADAYVLMEELRWGGQVVCPHCGSVRAYFLNPANGESRKTRTGSMSERRVWKCAGCRKQFSVLTGTIFHGTKIPLRSWVLVVFEMCSSKNGVAAREIERKYGLTPKSAWFMLHRIREAMKRDPLAGLLSGAVIADETWIGGKPRNRHASKRYPGGKPGHTDKQPVRSLLSKDTGEVRSFVVPKVTGDNLARVLNVNTDRKRTKLHTDSGTHYTKLGPDFAAHETVNHFAGEYVREGVTTNHVEGFFSQLKRSIDRTHHQVTVKHLHRYLGEFDFRYSTHRMDDTERTNVFMGQVNRRLSYKPLKGGA